MTPMLKLILEYARQRVLQLDELGYRPIAKSNSEYRHTLGIDERGIDRYNKACLLVEIAAGNKTNPANLYDLDKDELVQAIDKALDRKRGK